MDIPFLGRLRTRRGPPDTTGPWSSRTAADGREPGSADTLLAECELLRERAERHGVALDDSAASLAALDQLVPSWREDHEDGPEDGPEATARLGTDAGLYLGTVILHTVPGSSWRFHPDGTPVVRLGSGREIDVLALGEAWADSGSPELSQVQAEAAED